MLNERIINCFKLNNKIIYDLKYNSNDKFLFIQKQYDLNIIKLHVTNKNFNVKLNIDFHYLQTFDRKYFEINKHHLINMYMYLKICYELIKNFQKYNKIYTIIYKDYDMTIVRDDGINGLFINRFIALKEYKIESFAYLVDNEDFTKFNFSNKEETENIKSKLYVYSLYLLSRIYIY